MSDKRYGSPERRRALAVMGTAESISYTLQLEDELSKLKQNQYKQSGEKMGTWHTPHNKDGGCQMPYKVIDGFCAVCGSPNHSCQPDKQPKTSGVKE